MPHLFQGYNSTIISHPVLFPLRLTCFFQFLNNYLRMVVFIFRPACSEIRKKDIGDVRDPNKDLSFIFIARTVVEGHEHVNGNVEGLAA